MFKIADRVNNTIDIADNFKELSLKLGVIFAEGIIHEVHIVQEDIRPTERKCGECERSISIVERPDKNFCSKACYQQWRYRNIVKPARINERLTGVTESL